MDIIFSYLSNEILKGLWLALLIVICIIVFFGRKDTYIKIGVAFIALGYTLIILKGSILVPEIIDTYLTRIGYTVLLARLATRLGKEKIP